MGVTLLELLIVIAVVGTLSAIGITSIPRDRFQVREATRVISADINRARSEAIQLNTEVELRFNTASDCYTLSETKDQNKTVLATPRRILERCIRADFPLADVSAAVFSATPAVSFNSRGLPTNSLGGSVTVQSRGRSSYTLQVMMASQGRLRVQ